MSINIKKMTLENALMNVSGISELKISENSGFGSYIRNFKSNEFYDRKIKTVIAFEDEKPIGWVWYFEAKNNDHYKENLLWIMSYVQEDRRGSGIGKRLVRYAGRYALKNNLKIVAYHEYNFYNKTGIKYLRGCWLGWRTLLAYG